MDAGMEGQRPVPEMKTETDRDMERESNAEMGPKDQR